MPDKITTDDVTGDEVVEAADPFVRLHDINEPISAHWPDDKPLADITPGVWPEWGDLKRLVAAIRAHARVGALKRPMDREKVALLVYDWFPSRDASYGEAMHWKDTDMKDRYLHFADALIAADAKGELRKVSP